MNGDAPERRRGSVRDLVTHMFLESGRPCPDAGVFWYPATDAWAAGGEFVVRMDLSGVARDELRIVLRETVLEVTGVRGEPADEAPRTYHKMEIARGPFARRLQLPPEFARGEARAAYRDGVLEIRFRPRAAAGAGEVVIEPEGGGA